MTKKEKEILKNELLGALECLAYYERLCAKLSDSDKIPCTLKTAKTEYKDWAVRYDTLYNLAYHLGCELDVTDEEKDNILSKDKKY